MRSPSASQLIQNFRAYLSQIKQSFRCPDKGSDEEIESENPIEHRNQWVAGKEYWGVGIVGVWQPFLSTSFFFV